MSAPTRLSFVAASFAEKLRRSYWVRNLSYTNLLELYDQLPMQLRQTSKVRELGRLIKKSSELDQRGDKFESQFPIAQMNFDRVPILR